MIKKTIFYVLLFICANLMGQNKPLLFGFDAPQALHINPGMEVDFKWFASIPLTNVSFYAGSSGLAANDIIGNDGIDINQKFRENVLYSMSPKDELSGNYQIEFFSAGFRAKNNIFYSFGAYNEGDAIGYWFKVLALLAFEGNANNVNKRFDLSHFKTRGDIVNVYHFGMNKRLNKKLTVGARVKLYGGHLDFTSTKNEGYFITTEGENNRYASTIDADTEFNISHNFNEVSSLGKIVLGHNLGFGVDLGFTYNKTEHTTITGSIIDLGAMFNTTHAYRYSLKGKATVEGIDILLPEDLGQLNREYWQEIIDEVEELVPYTAISDSYTSFRPVKLNVAVNHGWGEVVQPPGDCNCGPEVVSLSASRYEHMAGGHLFMVKRPRGPQVAVSGFYQRRVAPWLTLKTTLSADKFVVGNLGLGLSTQLGPIQFYILADNLFGYTNLAGSHYQSFQFGLNIISWGKQ